MLRFVKILFTILLFVLPICGGIVDKAPNDHNRDASHGNVSSPVDVEHEHHNGKLGSETHHDMNSPNGAKNAASPSKTAAFQQKFANMKQKAGQIGGQVTHKIENKVAELAMTHMDDPDDAMVPDLDTIAKNMQNGGDDDDDLWTTLNKMVDEKSSMWKGIQDRNPWDCKATKEPKNCEAWEKLWKELGHTLVEAWRKLKHWVKEEAEKDGMGDNEEIIAGMEKAVLYQRHLCHRPNPEDYPAARPGTKQPPLRVTFTHPEHPGVVYDLNAALHAVQAVGDAAPRVVQARSSSDSDEQVKPHFRPALKHVDKDAFHVLVKGAFGTHGKEGKLVH